MGVNGCRSWEPAQLPICLLVGVADPAIVRAVSSVAVDCDVTVFDAEDGPADLIAGRDVALIVYSADHADRIASLLDSAVRSQTARLIAVGSPPKRGDGRFWHWKVADWSDPDLPVVAATALQTFKAFADHRKTRLQLDAIIGATADTINIKDVNGTYLLCNDKAAEYHRVGSPSDIVGLKTRDMHPDDVAEQLEQWDRAAIERGITASNVINRTIDGEERTFVLRKSPVRHGGRVIGVLSVGTDITDYVKIQNELATKHRLIEAMVNALDSGIVITDQQDRIQLFNKMFPVLWGIDASDISIGMTICDLYEKVYEKGVMSREEVDKRASARADYINNVRGPRHIERSHPSGAVYQIKDHPLPDGGTVTTVLDITARKDAEKRLRQSQKMEAIGQLAGGIAHDFNNLLTVIQGNLGLLEMQYADDDEASKWLSTALLAAERGSALTRRLLSFSRRQHLEQKYLSLNELIDESLEILKRTLGENIRIEQSLCPELGAVLIDPNEFQNALINLAVNSRDAMANGGRLTIETSEIAFDEDTPHLGGTIKKGRYALVSVSDNGCGISKKALERVFEPFFTTKEVGKGTGLGLSMVYGFVKQSQGHISIYSEVGKGTSVKIYLPIGPGRIERAELPASYNNIDVSHTRIILVEDDAQVRSSATEMLKRLNCDVVAASTPSEAEELVRVNGDFDVLFTDIVMPGELNGFQLAERMRAIRPNLKVLYTSGYTRNAIEAGGKMLPGSEMLAKPYARSQLQTKLKQLLSSASL